MPQENSKNKFQCVSVKIFSILECSVFYLHAIILQSEVWKDQTGCFSIKKGQ